MHLAGADRAIRNSRAARSANERDAVVIADIKQSANHRHLQAYRSKFDVSLARHARSSHK